LSKSGPLKTSVVFIFSIILLGFGCTGPELEQPILTAEVPLHLEEHIDDANIVGSEVGEDLAAPVEWNFDEQQPDWKAAGPIFTEEGVVRLESIEDALRIHFSEANRGKNSGNIIGAIYIDLADWKREDWGDILIRARNSERFFNVRVLYNLGERMLPGTNFRSAIQYAGEITPLISDGHIHTYKLSVDVHQERWGEWKNPWRQLVLYFAAPDPASIDLLSVSVHPKEAYYADAPAGVMSADRNGALRRALYTHTPGRLEYRVRIPEAGRLDFGLGVLREEVPVDFKVVASQRHEEVVLFEETYSNSKEWEQRSVDLSSFAGKTVNLVLEANAEPAGSVALWTAPTVSGVRSTQRPNVIFYVIDGAGADLMSVYGYNRRTTPRLERIADEGAVFERAYSNSCWTRPSTLSFMTSLQHSVASLNQEWGGPQVPDQAMTMAEHVHRAGYQTAVLVSNDNAGRMSALDRGVDKMRDVDPENFSKSSVLLHEDFWKWRDDYPAEPYWVHFQTTDIHTPWRPIAPFAGLFVSLMRRQAFNKEFDIVDRKPGPGDFEGTGIDPVAHFHTARDIYDEAMAHQDYQLGRLVERLKAIGEWDNTLLIVAADHSHYHAGLSMLDPIPPQLDDRSSMSAPIMSPWISRIPMIFVWPGHIAPGKRFSDPVSMIDMLPTVLDLLDLPMPDVMQGQSLAPLLLGEPGWEPKPVIFDEMGVRRSTGDFIGRIEVIDGRWGASLSIHPAPDKDPRYLRPAPLLIFDLWNDHYCLNSLHEERPDLVAKYSKFLEEQWEAHQSLAKLFSRSKREPLTPEQLENLRSLGYIR
jgi:arylsulfatase A-like enzyme